jgi:NADP-dependent 3-hydroxy acid dehydrogenase YdfG
VLRFKKKVAVVTGASSGIGKAVAVNLANEGAAVCLLGRKEDALKAVMRISQAGADKFRVYKIDLERDADIFRLKQYMQREFGRVDVLIHSAGIFSMGELEYSSIEDLDRQYRVNVRSPYLLTQNLLPMIKACHGQIVFVNSSAGLNAKAKVSQYAAAKHALKAIADSLRAEVNDSGMRVLSIYPGRTATPMQALVHKLEGRKYNPDRLMQAEDVARILMDALALPRSAEVMDINIRSLKKIQ